MQAPTRSPPKRGRSQAEDMAVGPEIATAGSPAGLSRRVVLGATVLAVTLGVGAAALVHGLTGRSAASLSSSAVFMRHGLYGAATWGPTAVRAPQISTLPDQTGAHFELSSLRGRTVALVFFDSHCHQECPLEGRQLAAAERTLPRAQRPTLVVVSVNPKDTYASVRHAVNAWGLSAIAPWHWLMGTHRQLSAVWAKYHIQVSPPVNGDINHTEALYLINRSGFERAAFLWPFESKFASYDMRVLATRRGA